MSVQSFMTLKQMARVVSSTRSRSSNQEQKATERNVSRKSFWWIFAMDEFLVRLPLILQLAKNCMRCCKRNFYFHAHEVSCGQKQIHFLTYCGLRWCQSPFVDINCTIEPNKRIPSANQIVLIWLAWINDNELQETSILFMLQDGQSARILDAEISIEHSQLGIVHRIICRDFEPSKLMHKTWVYDQIFSLFKPLEKFYHVSRVCASV
jgi:hypothetical protein